MSQTIAFPAFARHVPGHVVGHVAGHVSGGARATIRRDRLGQAWCPMPPGHRSVRSQSAFLFPWFADAVALTSLLGLLPLAAVSASSWFGMF